ncbi:hypothetical protein [Catelliglobosispora koreensis]|uniref:hypothetical protein n=1 Tax=Catelliglobosispora koreensis TaxID=129052 RepID=UPI00036E7E7F|nr:hypothetical protein [Catelliglobosispora koreensis]
MNASDVISPLQTSGFTCKQKRATVYACELNVGAAGFEATVATAGNAVTRVSAIVRIEANLEPGPGTLVFLTWIATIPYSGDQASVTEIASWVTGHVQARTSAAATIGRYIYTLEASVPGTLYLTVEGDGKRWPA